nr:trimeric intracellular cation channel family protein [uncultured Lacibacter sp.]
MSFLSIIDILGTFAFAVSGAFSAIEKKLDPFGVIILSFVTAIGGGTLRDLLIGDTPVRWLRSGTTTLVIIAAAIATMFFGKFLKRFSITLFLFDAFGLGLFTLIGVQRGLQLEFSPGICVALGTITGSFGGVIRDVLLNNVPLVFRKEIYASASILGGILYLLLLKVDMFSPFASIISIMFIVALRIIVVRYKLALPDIYRR